MIAVASTVETVSTVLVTEAERTQRTVTVLVFGLLVVAALLGGLTAWYWQRTNPRRRARQLRLQGNGVDVNTRQMGDLQRPPPQGQPGVLNEPFSNSFNHNPGPAPGPPPDRSRRNEGRSTHRPTGHRR